MFSYIFNIAALLLITLGGLFFLDKMREVVLPVPKPLNHDKWAVLVAGSRDWVNYRHQADVCHAWHLLTKNGFIKEQIITMMYDDIAFHECNPYPGQLFNKPGGPNVYKGVVKDYVKEDVSAENFENILLGNENAMIGIGSGKVLKSGPKDKVFIYFVDHGETGLVNFPDYKILSFHQLHQILTKMSELKKFGQLVFYMEACKSGSMFVGLSNNENIYVTTAANATESSYSCYCNNITLPCIGDQYSAAWMEFNENVNTDFFTLAHEYSYIKESVTGSHVGRYGQLDLGLLPLNQIFGQREEKHIQQYRTVSFHPELSFPSSESKMFYLVKQLKVSGPETPSGKKLIKEIYSNFLRMKAVIDIIQQIVEALSLNKKDKDKILHSEYELKLEVGPCFNKVLEQYKSICFRHNYKDGAIYSHSQKFVNMCSLPGYSVDKITDTIKQVCTKYKNNHCFLTNEEDCWMGENLCNVLCLTQAAEVGKTSGGVCIKNKCKCNKSHVTKPVDEK